MRVADHIATPDGKRRYVRSLFAAIADRYDFITVALSYGQDRRWKRRVIDLAAPRAGVQALDLATGTGDIAFGLANRGARVVGLDVTRRMIELARAKRPPDQPAPAFLVGDMLALPFSDRSFDVVTVGYGLRNVPDLARAIDEIRRVLRPGGQMLSLDFDRPSSAIARSIYLSYLGLVGGALGWLLHRDPDTYRYIPASIRSYPGARAVATLMEARGFAKVACHRVLGGLMAIHHAFAGPDAIAPERDNVELETTKWSGEGEFTHTLIDRLGGIGDIVHVRVEDAPASRSDADYNFISNEVFVRFSTRQRRERATRFGFLPASRDITEPTMTISDLEQILTAVPGIGQPDYSDEGMLQYLRAERIVPPYQTRGYKLVELVRIYRA